MHESPVKCAQFLTSTGADSMAAVRTVSDAIELAIGDEFWPLPRYREMVFPV
jgi:glutamine synthetase